MVVSAAPLPTAAMAYVLGTGLPDGLHFVHDQDDGTRHLQPPAALRRRAHGTYTNTTAGISNTTNAADTGTFEPAYPPGPPLMPAGRPLRDNATDPPELIPLPITTYTCIYSVPRLNLTEYAQARSQLSSFCDKYLVPGRRRHLAVGKSGTVTTYVCNYRPKPQKCSRREYTWAEEHYLDLRCGIGTPGWVRMGGLYQEYGRGFLGMPICEWDKGVGERNKGPKKKGKKMAEKLETEIWWALPGDPEP